MMWTAVGKKEESDGGRQSFELKDSLFNKEASEYIHLIITN